MPTFPTGPNTLLLLSGGLDSAYCLWKHVRTGQPIRTHHVVLADHEGRQEVERVATQRVLAWVHAKVPGSRALIQHTESRVSFGDLRWIPKNYHLWAYWTGVIMAAPSGRAITDIILPRHSDAFAGGPTGPSARRSDTAYKGHVKLIAGREPVLRYPMAHLTKAQVIADMPQGLIDASWWCRTPRNGTRCHKCATCKLVDPALAARARKVG